MSNNSFWFLNKNGSRELSISPIYEKLYAMIYYSMYEINLLNYEPEEQKLIEASGILSRPDLKIKELKKLGQGTFGAAYSVEIGDKKYVLKKQRIPDYLVENYLFGNREYWIPEIALVDRLEQAPKGLFVNYISYKITKGYDESVTENESGYNIYLLMEDVEGVALETIHADISWKKYYAILVDILEQYKWLEKLKIVHGDGHPGNILWSEKRERAYLIDFGLSIPKDIKLKLKINLKDDEQKKNGFLWKKKHEIYDDFNWIYLLIEGRMIDKIISKTKGKFSFYNIFDIIDALENILEKNEKLKNIKIPNKSLWFDIVWMIYPEFLEKIFKKNFDSNIGKYIFDSSIYPKKELIKKLFNAYGDFDKMQKILISYC